MKHFIDFRDAETANKLVDTALQFKKAPFSKNEEGKNETLGLIFMNPSLRTRLSTQKAAINLGMNTMVMNMSGEGWALEFNDGTIMNGGAAEHVKDAARVMGQYCDIIGIRTFASLKNREEDYAEKLLSIFQEESGRPIISLESATRHPLQSLADLLTIRELSDKQNPKIVLSWAPHPKALPQAVANSFAEWMIGSGYDLTITHPIGFELSEKFSKKATVIHNQEYALKNADFVYVKNWSSFHHYGQTSQEADWTMTNHKMNLTNNARFMHCLPMRRNVVATDAVIDSPSSAVIQQAGNRVFSAQAVLFHILNHLNQ